MMEGMSEGLEDGQGEVAKTISNIAESITEGMGDASFNVGADGMVSGMDRVADKLMAFVDRLEAAANALVDGILPQPAIATGAYIPPRTRVDGTSFADDRIISAMEQQTKDQDELFSLIRGRTDEMIEILQQIARKNMTVDGNSLERTLDSMRRDRLRAFGGAY